MPEPIPATEVETLVGTSRHATEHIARADSKAKRTYVLHPVSCLDPVDELPSRDCPVSAAQDLGIDEVASEWECCEDQPVQVHVDEDGYMVPTYVEVPEGQRFAPGTRVEILRDAVDTGDGRRGGTYVIEEYVAADQRDVALPYYMAEGFDNEAYGICIPHAALRKVMDAAEHAEAMKMPEPEDIAKAISGALHSLFGEEISVHTTEVLSEAPDPTDRGPGFEGEHPYTHGVEFYGKTEGGRSFGATLRITALWETDY